MRRQQDKRSDLGHSFLLLKRKKKSVVNDTLNWFIGGQTANRRQSFFPFPELFSSPFFLVFGWGKILVKKKEDTKKMGVRRPPSSPKCPFPYWSKSRPMGKTPPPPKKNPRGGGGGDINASHVKRLLPLLLFPLLVLIASLLHREKKKKVLWASHF